MSYSLKKTDKLLKKKNFQKVISADNKKVGKKIRVHYRFQYDSLNPKLGITASSYFGNAIERNFFKRRMREIFRKNRTLINKSLEIVVYPKHTAKHASYDELKQEFLFLLNDV